MFKIFTTNNIIVNIATSNVITHNMHRNKMNNIANKPLLYIQVVFVRHLMYYHHRSSICVTFHVTLSSDGSTIFPFFSILFLPLLPFPPYKDMCGCVCVCVCECGCCYTKCTYFSLCSSWLDSITIWFAASDHFLIDGNGKWQICIFLPFIWLDI